MKILIADKFETWGVEELKKAADEVRMEPGLKGPELAARVADFNPAVLVVRSTKVTDDVLAASRKLRLVIRAGSGYDTIDVHAASERGIMVSNCPGMNSIAVAELVIGLMISLDRRIPDNVIDLRNGKWNKKGYSKAGLGLKGKVLGVVGAGRIGIEVATRALAFEMDVLYSHLGRSRGLSDLGHARRVEMDYLLEHADFVTIHVPGGESTRNLIDASKLARMKPTAFLINTARADVIDQAALVDALQSGRIRGAAADVYHGEPPADATEINNPLAALPNFYGTHHIGASTEQAQLAVAGEVVRIIEHYRRTGEFLNCINIAEPTRTVMLVARLHNKPGALAAVFTQLATEEINVEEMDHILYNGGKAACAHIRLGKLPSDTLLHRLTHDEPSVLGIELMQID